MDSERGADRLLAQAMSPTPDRILDLTVKGIENDWEDMVETMAVMIKWPYQVD